ncbi:sensor histidine kinase KdpD [Paludicola sp. MB14-C6]|uniref:sensor histidine kinase n=1 Tax=Paludihabitans sp. MB14-C6 TaxID=3070656 RepID=UPI0027DC2064|nr:sensor histidine kinase KdpD [Paludicola sp. MB14-C6]WMJ23590.1 sensor histidine kinase KdpD [Paludicola sp. MB14-C6]
MDDKRPDAYTILKRIERTETRKKGKLKIFFGYAAGVGKTYAMLEAAHEVKNAGGEVVAGYIEPHTRPETTQLVNGLETLPPLIVEHKGITIKEFDLDSAIKRNPQLILVDELAHTNAPGCRHIKRYQDIQELLKAGIDVYTTVNVQHIESLNDIVSSITGVKVRERIPDKVIDDADQIELVDIEPEELIIRLNKGKIYREEQAKRALHNFFTVENLIALREIALRRTADQVNRKAEKAKELSQRNDYYTNEHILICLSSSPSNAKVIRTAARMANSFHGEFTALFVETPGTTELSDENRARLRTNLKLAEQLGAKIATVYGDNVPEQIAEYAKACGISKIVLGRSNNKKGIVPRASFVDKLTQIAPNLDIFIIPNNLPAYVAPKAKQKQKNPVLTIRDSLITLSLLALSTAICFLFYELSFSEANIIIVYILGVLFTAVATQGRIYSIVSSIISVVVFNFFFTDPRFSLEAYDSSYPITFLIMLVAAFVTSTLTVRAKQQAKNNARKARNTQVLLETSRMLQRSTTKQAIYNAMGKQMEKLLSRMVIIYPVNKTQGLDEPILFSGNEEVFITEYTSRSERAVAEWVYKNNKSAGATTTTLPNAKCLYLAVRGHHTVYAVVAVTMQPQTELDTYDRNLLIAMLGEFGLVLEKEEINETKNEIALEAQREQLRANILRAISHDLRTPLTSISGNASILMGDKNYLDENKKLQLYTDIYDDSMWLINLVENLLSVTRIENGTISITMQSELLEEVIAEALRHINRKSVDYQINVSLSDDLLMAKMDSRLIIQVIINIVDNAIKYTPPGSIIDITARKSDNMVLVEIKDNGEGISNEDKKKIFDMFFTVDKNNGDSHRGLGLGLSLCKSIIIAHGGDITVKDNNPHGTVFSFTLQAEEVVIDE